jgi:hypothetical protein
MPSLHTTKLNICSVDTLNKDTHFNWRLIKPKSATLLPCTAFEKQLQELWWLYFLTHYTYSKETKYATNKGQLKTSYQLPSSMFLHKFVSAVSQICIWTVLPIYEVPWHRIFPCKLDFWNPAKTSKTIMQIKLHFSHLLSSRVKSFPNLQAHFLLIFIQKYPT